jgi:two-component system, chemotaxis family, chemotaxis protein CheY
MGEVDAVPPARLLALDDNLPLAELITRVAGRCGYEAQPIDDPAILPKLLRDWKPDVLTLDLSMPQEDGMSVLSSLGESQFAGSIVIISGHDSWLRKAARRLAVGRGLNVADDLEKPVDISSLRQILLNLRPNR